jgi:pyruvate formate lyase activating enzyme
MKDALLWEKLPGGKVRCNLCHFHCVIPEGKSGICKVRVNKNGELKTILNSYASSIALDPIEKKPLFHFYPGTKVLSLGTWSCNFRCKGCQNYELSRTFPTEGNIASLSREISPEESIRIAKKYGASGIAWTYNEPTIWFEYTLESARLAKQAGLYTVYVTNGSMTEEALDLIGPYLDAFSVDVKAFSAESYRKITPIFDWRKILDTIIYAKNKWNIHIEIVTNVVPTINDSNKEMRDLARWIKNYLGRKTPWHITRFFPYLELSHLPPTPIETLERIHDIGVSEGLEFVYAGNIAGHPYENTYCPKCKRAVIVRDGFKIIEKHTHNGKCNFCKEDLNIIE